MKPFLLAAAFILSTSAALSQAPEWYATHAHGRYHPSSYLIGVGAADGANGVEKAKKNAQVDLVSQIRVHVKSEMKNVTESFQLNKEESVFSDFTSRSRTVVNEEVPGIEIVETYVDPSTQAAYALAALDRKKYTQGLAAEMDAAWREASELRTAADGFLKQGKLSDALRSCADARTMITDVLPKIALHDAVAGRAYSAPNPLTPVSLTTEMRTMLSNVKIEKRGGDGQAGKIGTRFAVPMKVRVLCGNVPMHGAMMRFETTENVPLCETVTDENGEAQYPGRIRAVPGNIIRVRPAFGDLSREFERNTLSASAQFAFTPQPSDIAIELAVAGVNDQAAEKLRAAVASAVGRVGYRVVPSSRYRIETVLRPQPALKTEGMSGAFYTVRVEAVSTLADKRSHADLGSVTASAAGGGKSESEAAEKAAAKIAPDPMKLAELIEKIPH